MCNFVLDEKSEMRKAKREKKRKKNELKNKERRKKSGKEGKERERESKVVVGGSLSVCLIMKISLETEFWKLKTPKMCF